MNLHKNEIRFGVCDDLVQMCLQKEPGNRVANGSILMKSRGIQNLIYQLNSGIPPSDFSFSNNIAFVAQSVNEKLLQKINQLKKEQEQHESEIKELSEKLKNKQSK